MWKCSKCETMNDAEFCAVCGASKSEAVVPPTRHSDSFATSSTGYTAPPKLAGTLIYAGKENALRIASIAGMLVHFLFLFLPTITVGGSSLFSSIKESYSAAGYILSYIANNSGSNSYSFVDNSSIITSLVFVLIYILISHLFLLACILFLSNLKKNKKTKAIVSILANILPFLSVPFVLMVIESSKTGLLNSFVTASMNAFGWIYLFLTICGTIALVMYYFEFAKSTSVGSPAGLIKTPVSGSFSLACPSCGSKLIAGATFCSSCGKPVSPSIDSTAASADSMPVYPSPWYSPTSTTMATYSTGEIKSSFKPKDSTDEEESNAAAVAELKNTFKKSDDLD